MLTTINTDLTKVAHVLASLIEKSGRTRKEIAYACGLGKPNMISMLKSGETKLPLARLGSFSKAVGADPVELLKLCMKEYYPDVWEAINSHLLAAVTSDGLRIVKALRRCTGAPCLSSLSFAERESLDCFLEVVAKSTTVH